MYLLKIKRIFGSNKEEFNQFIGCNDRFGGLGCSLHQYYVDEMEDEKGKIHKTWS
jgi:hypothetical protein